jgi:hypothetical protein
MHSDAAGALNMLQLKQPGFDRDAVKATAVPTVHTWQLHAWKPRTSSQHAVPLHPVAFKPPGILVL